MGAPFFKITVMHLMMVVLALYFAVKKDIGTGELIRLAFKLPTAFLGMMVAIFTSKKASNKFIHIPHNIN